MEILQSDEQTERQMDKYKRNVWDLWNNIKCTNLSTKVVPEGKKKEKGEWKMYLKKLWLKTSLTQIEMFPIQVLEAQRVPQK